MFTSHLAVLDIIIYIVVAAAVALMSFYFGKINGHKEEKRKLFKRYEEATSKFARRLQNQIKRATEAQGADLIMQAKAIVATRNQMSSALGSVAKLLNSEIDNLEKVLYVRTDPAEIREIVFVLDKIWDTKPDLIDLQCRKLLTELGITETFENGMSEHSETIEVLRKV